MNTHLHLHAPPLPAFDVASVRLALLLHPRPAQPSSYPLHIDHCAHGVVVLTTVPQRKHLNDFAEPGPKRRLLMQ